MTTTEKIWNEFHKKLFHFINKRIKDPDISSDILQEIFIKIHLKLHTLADSEKLTSWIYMIARNSILDYFRTRKPNHSISGDIEDEKEEESFISGIACCLYPFIETLPEKYKDALLQTDLGALSQKEYAAKIEISYTAAKSRIQRAREKLKELFNDCCITSDGEALNECSKNAAADMRLFSVLPSID